MEEYAEMKMEICKVYDQVNQYIVILCLHKGMVVSFQVEA